MIKAQIFLPSTTPAENAAVGAFVSRGLWGYPDGFRDFSSMGVFLHGRLVAGTVFHNYHASEGVMELSSYSQNPRWLARPVINTMFSFPFDVMGCQLVVLRVSDRNDRMNAIARRFGFSSVHVPRLRGVDEGEFIHTLTVEDWRAHDLRDSSFEVIMPL